MENSHLWLVALWVVYYSHWKATNTAFVVGLTSIIYINHLWSAYNTKWLYVSHSRCEYWNNKTVKQDFCNEGIDPSNTCSKSMVGIFANIVHTDVLALSIWHHHIWNKCFYLQTFIVVYIYIYVKTPSLYFHCFYRLSIYHVYIWYESVHCITTPMIELRSNLHSQATPHTSPLRASHGVSFMSYTKNTWLWYIERPLHQLNPLIPITRQTAENELIQCLSCIYRQGWF